MVCLMACAIGLCFFNEEEDTVSGRALFCKANCKSENEGCQTMIGSDGMKSTRGQRKSIKTEGGWQCHMTIYYTAIQPQD